MDWVSQGVVTLAERDGTCVGLLAAAPAVPSRIPTGVVPAGSMFVYTVLSDRGRRGRGVGRALLQRAEDLAKAGGAPAMALDHWAGSAELSRIYDGYGYVRVADYIDLQDGKSVHNVVRVRPISPAVVDRARPTANSDTIQLCKPVTDER
jgi:GNAT superfamily N-acetyltransferase